MAQENGSQTPLPVRIVVTGGVLSVMMYRNRSTTADIDFYHGDYEVIEMISEAKARNESKEMKLWPRNWINAEMTAFINNVPGCEDLYNNSIQQDICIWRSEFLEVYAVDLRFQLVGKVERACDLQRIPESVQSVERGTKDIEDSLCILSHLINMYQRPLRKAEVKRWYSSILEEEHFTFINRYYQERYGHEGIVD